MKKFIYTVLILAIAGAAFSGILTHQHFYDTSKAAEFFCGEGINNPCKELSLSKYSSLFGVPVSVYGIIFYSLVVFTLLIADYAKGGYYRESAAVLLPLSGLALIGDIALFIIMIITGIFCPICIATYLINIFMFIALIFWWKNIKKSENISLLSIYREIIDSIKNMPDRKAALSSYIMFVLFLAFSFILTSHILEIKTGDSRLSFQKIKKYIDEYNNISPEEINLPGSMLVVGNPDARITITVFTDFLCSFCSKFYEVEEYLTAKYRDKIKFEYYSYPLDKNCNPNLNRTVYNNSCAASKAMYAAAEAGFLAEYMRLHFHNYTKIRAAYNKDIAVRIFNQLGTEANTGRFIEAFDSKSTSEKLTGDINAAMEKNIRSTPTIFIGNKRISGYRPKEVFDIIVKALLDRQL